MAQIILGLGNPGAQYADTRHNVGFRVVEELARRWRAPLDRLECNSRLGGGTEDVPLLVQPQTYMNRSGYAARCLVELHQIEPSSVLVVYDEINLPLGKLRLRRSGSPAGHRGLESILENLRTDEIPRLRLGIAPAEGPPPGENLPDFVLAPFTEDEREPAEEMIRRAADACEAWLREGVDLAMNRFNG